LVLDTPGLFEFLTRFATDALDLDTPRSDPNIPCLSGESNPDLPGWRDMCL
jgi:hypothetical protein